MPDWNKPHCLRGAQSEENSTAQQQLELHAIYFNVFVFAALPRANFRMG